MVWVVVIMLVIVWGGRDIGDTLVVAFGSNARKGDLVRKGPTSL